MSVNRNKNEDRENTRRLLADPKNRELYKDISDKGKNWLGHSFSAKTSQLDEMLIKGAKLEDMLRVRNAIFEHIHHLSKEHGLFVKRRSDEKYRIFFDEGVLSLDDPISKELMSVHEREWLEAFERTRVKGVSDRAVKNIEAIRAHSANCNFKAVYDQIRPLHDKFFWMAKGDSLCRGAIYRTEGFMRMPKHERCGARVGQTVHIEHTIPAAAIRDCIKNWSREAVGPFPVKALYEAIMTISICTAMDMFDKACGTRKGLHSRNPAVEGLSWCDVKNNKVLARLKPFQRYEDHINIYDVCSGKRINKNKFSLLDHKRLVQGYISLLD